jgi:predicted type IV restriction endonuclease
MGESLEEVVATLVKKLDRWRGINEAQTSQVIILRLLKALGWDIWDPEEVKAQDSSSKSYRPDFLLNVNGKPAFVLEVKALDKTPTDEDRTQVVNYANSQNIRWAVLTTGRVWEFFDNKEEAKAPEKRVLLFQLDNPSAKEYLERTLSKSLWKEANASGKLSRIAKDIRKEIETQQSLTKIENILRKALEEGYQRSEKGLRKAIEKELSANDQELALSHFNVLLRRILEVEGPSEEGKKDLENSMRSTASEILRTLARLSATDQTAPQEKDADFKAWFNENTLGVGSWRDLYVGIVEALYSLDRQDIIKDWRNQLDIVPSILTRRKRDGSPYPPTAYRKLSSGEYLFVHLAAERIRKKIRDILVLLEMPPGSLRVEYLNDVFLIP